MPFERPTLPQLIDEGATEYESRLPGVLARVRRSLVGVINRVTAAALSALYKYAQYVVRQAWPDQCDVELLDQHGARWAVTRTPAAKATGGVGLAGLSGTVVPAGTQWQRADGTLYETLADVELVGGVATATVRALVAGQAGNALVGVALTLTTPIAGVNSSAVASTALAGGADVEKDEPYRGRIVERVRQPPHGGRDTDYPMWAKEVPGVTRVWVSPRELGAGTVVVRFVRDDDASPIPDAGEVAAVQAHIDAAAPVTAVVTVAAPVAVSQNYTIQLTPNTPAVRAAVIAELQAMHLRDSAPGATTLITHVSEAISIAAGETDHVLVSPTGNVTHAAGEMAVMGTVTWA
ncbi:baseplate J/gp47 family protein [Pseudacidovorax intermedius]|uniref:baseplate J/gp47 family protein n=1 Tax=Pseudacidovorax intermedius TaxID=433924 RepID=UPI0026EB4CC7|nr:baseplate J/gp47 family protein [Pseudacidovorax intermedius]